MIYDQFDKKMKTGSHIREWLHLTYAATQSCRSQPKPVAFASTMAARLAVTFNELFTTLCNGRFDSLEDSPFFTTLFPTGTDSLLLAGEALPDPIRNLPDMLNFWCVEVELLWLEGWPHIVSAFWQTGQVWPHSHCQQCLTCPTWGPKTSPASSCHHPQW